MNSIGVFPILQFVACPSEVFEDLAIYEFDPTLGVHNGDHPGNGVDDQAEALFAHSESFLRALPVFQVDIDSVPFDDLARLVQLRIGAEEEAAIFTVGPSEAPLCIEWPRAHQRVSVSCQHFGEIVSVDRYPPSPTGSRFGAEARIVQPAPVDR